MSPRKKKKNAKPLVPGPRKGPIRVLVPRIVKPRRRPKLGDTRCPKCSVPMVRKQALMEVKSSPKDLRTCPHCLERVVAVKTDDSNDLVSFVYVSIPGSISLSHKEYQRLFKLVRWYQDTPDDVQLPDSAHERITEAIQDHLPASLLLDEDTMYVSEVQIEDVMTVRAGHDFTEIDQLVAIVYVEGACLETEEEQHVPILATL